MLQILQNALIPALLAGISLYALCKGVDVFPTFLRGAAVGLKTAVQILPVMVGMLTVVFMLRASGAVDIAGKRARARTAYTGHTERMHSPDPAEADQRRRRTGDGQ